MDLPKRKQNRLKDHDYSSPGCYFVTICTHEKHHLLWENVGSVGADIIRPKTPRLSRYGRIVEHAIQGIPGHYRNVKLEKYVVMPNHVHLLLRIKEPDGRMISAPTKGLPTIVGQMKRVAAKDAGIDLWQKGYHDHVIRNDADYLRIWHYIDTNPAKWREDCYYCDREEP